MAGEINHEEAEGQQQFVASTGQGGCVLFVNDTISAGGADARSGSDWVS
jgi:hypothetical protein